MRWKTYIDWADEVLVPHEQICEEIAKENCEDPSTEEAFKRLLGRKLDELGAAESNAADVGEDVVGDDERSGDEEPDEPLEDVVHDEVGLDDEQEERHVCPGEHGELELVVAFLEGDDEEDEAWELLVSMLEVVFRNWHTEDVQHKADEPMVRRKRQQNAINQQDVLEVVYDALAIQIIHRRTEEVPVQRLGEAQAARPAGHIDDGNDLFERDDLQRRHNHYNVDVAGKEGEEEAADHDEGPYCARDEGLLLLFVLVFFGGLGYDDVSVGVF